VAIRYELTLPGYVRRMAALHFPGSTTLGHALIRLRGERAEIRLEVDSHVVDFVFPIQTKASYRLIRGEFHGRGYDLSVPYEAGLIHHLARCLTEGATFIDIGANVGWFTLIGSRLVGESGSVYSFEPDGDNFRRLCENVFVHNRMTNCVTMPVALSNRADVISLARPRFDDGTGGFMASGGSRMALCARADSILRHLPDRPVHVKVDVEAAEFLAIDGFGELLGRVSSFAVEVSSQSVERFGVSHGGLFKLMFAHGFSASRLEADGSLEALTEPATGDIVFRRG
jgi:FkbM family methyltransferase